MRINEIASAEEQIELWRLVSNSVWQSLQQQEREEQQRKAAATAARKNAPKGKRGRRSAIPSQPKVPAPKPPTPPKQPTRNKMAVTARQPNAVLSAVPKPFVAASAQSNAQQLPPSLPADSLYNTDTAVFQPNYIQKKSDGDTDDRHNKNTFQPTVARSALPR